MVVRGTTRQRAAIGLVSGMLCLCAGAGCSSRAEVRLTQPQAPPAQQDMQLESDWAFMQESGGRRDMLLDFPLPGSKRGPRDFRLFLSMPGVDGPVDIDPYNPNAAHGFLIQVVGRLKGKTEFISGRVECEDALPLSRQKKVTFDLRSADGAGLSGAARLRDDPAEIRAFERAYPADIELLRMQQSPPTSAPSSQPAE